MTDDNGFDDLWDDAPERVYLTVSKGRSALEARALIATSSPAVVEAAVKAINRALKVETRPAQAPKALEVVRS